MTPSSSASAGGFNPQLVDRIRQTFQEWTDRGIIAGAATLLYRHDAIAHVDTIGWQDDAARIPLRRDTLFRIASMTKPITCFAALMLVEEGRLRLDEPIAKWIPELAQPRVLLDPSGPLEQSRPAARPITLHHLFTHTSGLTYPWVASGPLAQRLGEMFAGLYGFNGPLVPTNQWMTQLGNLPLAADPGTQALYSLSTDVLGVLIGRVSGMPFNEFLAQRIFEPLGMRDTAFIVPPEKKSRLAVGYYHDPVTDRRVITDPVETSPLVSPLVFPSGGGGLASTLDDYLQFCRVLLGRGEADGKKLLAPSLTDLMLHRVEGPDFIAAAQPGMNMTLAGGAGVITDAATRGTLLPNGSVVLGGGYGTGACIVASKQMIAIYMTQLRGGPGESLIRPKFPELVMQAIEN